MFGWCTAHLYPSSKHTPNHSTAAGPKTNVCNLEPFFFFILLLDRQLAWVSPLSVPIQVANVTRAGGRPAGLNILSAV